MQRIAAASTPAAPAGVHKCSPSPPLLAASLKPQSRSSLPRPATASRSRVVGEYSLIKKAADAPLCGSPTTRAMEILTCVQQLDLDLCSFDMCTASPTTGSPRRAPSPTIRRGTPPSPPLPLLARHSAPRHSAPPCHPRRPTTAATSDSLIMQSNIDAEVLLRRKAISESKLAHKLQLLIGGESRRERATITRIERPIIQLAMRRASVWMKIISTVRPMIILSAELRFRRARRILRGSFAQAAARFVRRRRARFARKHWEAARVANMAPPTRAHLLSAIPIVRHLPPEAIDEIIPQLTPKCFRQHEYLIFATCSTKLNSAGGRPTAQGQGRLSLDVGGGAKKDSAVSQREQEPLLCAQTGATTTTTTSSMPGHGEKPRRYLYYIAKGRVRSTSTAGRTGDQARDQHVLEVLSEGQSVGTEALMEAESSTLIVSALTDVDAWELPVESLHSLLLRHSSSIRSALFNVAEQRRKDVLRQQPLTADAMRNASAHFKHWSASGISGAIAHLEPVLFSRTEEIRVRGVYFVINGKVEVERRSSSSAQSHHHVLHHPLEQQQQQHLAASQVLGASVASPDRFHTAGYGGSGGVAASGSASGAGEIIRPGQCFGELQCFFGEVRRHAVKAVAAVPTDAWLLPKADFLELAAHEHVATLVPLVEAASVTGLQNAPLRRR